MLSFGNVLGQVDLEINRPQIIIPPTGTPPQICSSESSPLQFRIDNIGNLDYVVTNASSITVTLTLSGGNTFSPSGQTTLVHTYASAPVVKGGSPANTIEGPGGHATFDWPASKPIIFSNAIQANINVEIATAVASDTSPANNSASYIIDIIPNPITPTLTAGPYGSGTINVCQGANVTFTVLPNTAGLRHQFDIAGVIVQDLVNVNTYATTGLVTNQLINVTSYNTDNCGVTGNPIRVLVHPVPVGTLISDKSNDVVCPGEDVLFTALATGADAVNPRYEFYLDNVSVQASSSQATFSLGTASITLDGHDVRVRTWNDTGAGGLCFDDDTITLRYNTFSGSNQITTTTTSVCAGVDPDPISNVSDFLSDLGGDIVHVWEEDIDGDGNFLPITPAETGLTFDPPILTQTTAYRRLSYPRFSSITCNSSIASATSNIVTITLNPTSVASLRSNASTSSNTLCEGDALILDASLSTGTQSYIFYKNDQPLPPSTPQSVTSYTLASGAFNDNDVIKVRAYSGTGTDSCFSEAQFVIRINAIEGANTIGNSLSVCENQTPLTSFTSISTPTLPNSTLTDGATITYQWESRSGTNTFVSIASPAGRSELYTPSSVSTDTDFRRVAISTFNNKTCRLISNTVRLTVLPEPIVSLTGTNTACVGEAVLFTASGAGSGRYEFFNGGTSLGASSTVSTISRTDLLDLDSITVQVTDGNGCSVISDPIVMSIKSPPSASISTGLSFDTTCPGDFPVFTAGPAVVGYTYEFFVNNSLQTTGVTSNIFDSDLASTTVNFLDVNTIRVRVTNENSCSDVASVTFYLNSLTGSNSISASQTICEGGTPNTLIGISNPTANSAGATISYQWEEKSIGGNFAPIFGANSVDFSPSSLTASRVYRRLVYSNFNGSVCPSSKVLAASNSVTITVDSNSVPVISFTSGLQSDVLCDGDSVTFDASGTTSASTFEFYVEGIRVRAALNSNTFTPILGSLNDFDVVRVRANSALGTSCFSEQSITVRVNEQLVANTITGSQTVCFNGPVSDLLGSTVTGTPTITYQWQSRIGTDTFSNIDGAVGVNYTPSSLSSTTVFRRNVLSTLSSKTCIVSSNVVTVTVAAGTPPLARLVTSNNVACGGLNPPMALQSVFIFDASSSTNDQSYEFFVGGASQGPPSSVPTISLTLTDSQTVRVDVYPQANGGGCPTSDSVTVRVNSIVGDNIIGGTSNICDNDDPSALTSITTPTSATGTLTYQWQLRTNTNTFTNISPGGNGADYDPTNLSTTTFYRRLAVSTIGGLVCTVPSNVVTITVDSTPIITGVLSSDAQTICVGNTPNTETVSFTVSAAASSIIFYINDTAVQTSTSRTYTASQSIFSDGDIVTTRLINSGGCFSEQNLIVNVNNIDPGSIDGSQAVCAGSTPIPLTSVSSGVINGVTIVSPGTGSYQWQTSTDTLNWIDIRFATSDTYSPAAAPPATIHYRRLTVNTLNGYLCEIPSNSITVSVDNLPIPGLTANGGAVTAPATITSCASNTISFIASGGAEYEFFVNNISVQSRDASTTFLASNPSDSNEVLVRVYKTASASSCFADSEIIKVDLETPPVASISPSISNNVFCSGTDVIFTAGSGGVASATYEFIVNSTSYITSTTNTFNTRDYPITLTGNPFIEVIVTSPAGCTSVASVTLIENVISSNGTITSTTASVCLNEVPGPIVGSAAVASGTITYGWQSSSDGISYSPITAANSSTYTPITGLTSTTFYQRITYSEINSVTCSSTSAPYRVSISPAPIPNLIASPGALTAPATLTLCDNTGLGIFVASGGASYEFRDENGVVLQARSSTSSFSSTTSSTLLNNSQVIVRVFSEVTGGCFEDSNPITIQISPEPNVSLNTIGGVNTFCSGDVVTLTATSTIASSTFEFRINGGNIQRGASNTYSATLSSLPGSPIGPDLATGNYFVTVSVTSPGGCTVTDTLTLFENNIPIPAGLTTVSPTICSGDIPQPIVGTTAVASGTTVDYVWMRSSDGGVTYNTIGDAANTATYTPTSAIVTTTFYRRDIVSTLNLVSCTFEGGPIQVAVAASPPPGLRGTATSGTKVASDTLEICPGELVVFTATGGAEYRFIGRGGVTLQSRSASSTFSTNTLLDLDTVQVEVFNAGGCSSFSELITINIGPGSGDPDLQTTTSTLNDTFCSGDVVTLTATSTIAGSDFRFTVNGAIQQNWSTTSTFVPILNTPDVATGNYFVTVEVRSPGGCTATDTLTLFENTISEVGTLTTASTTICSGDVPQPIVGSAAAASGTISYQWEESFDNITYTPIVGAPDSATYTPTSAVLLSASRIFYKRITTSLLNGKVCTAETAPVLITISSPTPSLIADPGNISATGTLTLCEGSEARFTAGGGLSYEFYVNDIIRGTRSNQSTFTISSVTNSPALRNNERVRVIVFDQVTGAGGCSALSDEIIIRTIDIPTVTLTRSDSTGSIFCTGDEPFFTANSSLTSPTYEFYIGPIRWQNSTSTVFTPTNYVPLLTDGDVISVIVNAPGVAGCSATDSITLVENAFTDSGLITNPSPLICSGGTPAAFTNVVSASGTGSITYRWQSGTSTATLADIFPFVTTLTFTPTTSITTHTFYRRRAISTIGVDECESFSNIIEIRIAPALSGGTIIPANQEICSGDSPGVISVTGGSIGPLITYQWQTSSDGFIYSTITTATGQTYTPSSLNTTTFFKRITNINGGGPPASCTAESSIVRIDILDLDPGSLDNTLEQAYCYGTMPPTLSSSVTAGVLQDAYSSVGTISYQWQESPNDGTWTDIPSATQNYYNPPSLIQTTFYRRVAISTSASNVCRDFTDSIRIEIIDELNAGTILPSNQDICAILTPADLPSSLVLTSPETATSSVTYQWQQSTDKSVWFDITGQQNLRLNFSVGADGVGGTADDDSWLPSSTSTTTYYRVVTTYVGDPVPFAQEQTRILLSDLPRGMTVGDYTVSVNGNNHTISSVTSSSLDQIGTDLAAKITSDDPLVNANYNLTTNIITLEPITPGTYNVASSILIIDDTVAVSFPDNPPVFMKILVSGNTGTRSPNDGVESCQAYSDIAEISVEPHPELTLSNGITSPQQACSGDPIIPIEYTFSSVVDEVEIRGLDSGLIPEVSGVGSVIGPFDTGGLGIAGWYRITNSASRTFTIQGSVTNSTNFSMVTILNPASQCNPITETYVIQVTPNAVQPNFIRKGQNLPGYEVLSSDMSSIASITSISPLRWYNNTVCQDRLPAPTTQWTDFYACYTDNIFNQQSNIYEWEVSPPEAGNMVSNNFQETTIQLITLTAPAVGENYTVSITTTSGTTAHTTTSTLATQTTDEIGIDLASKISLNSEVNAIYNNILDQIIIEAATTNLAFTATVSPVAAGQSTQLSPPATIQITRSGTMQWDPSFTGSSTIRVRSIGCGSNVSSWTSVVIDVIPETVPSNPASDLYPPVVIDAGICSGATTGIVPLCQVDAFTLPTQFFTASDNASNINDYGSLEWRMQNIAPGSLTVATPGTIDQATGIITWNIGWWGTFDLQVRPVDCDGGFGNWSTSTINIGPTNGPVTDVTPITALPECPIPDGGFSTTLRSSQEVNWYVNSPSGLVSSTTFINTVTFQLTPEANNDLILDFEPGFSGNIIITAEPALCPGSSVNYVINIPEPPTLVLTSGFNSNLQIGATSICRNSAINTITYEIEGAAEAVTVTGLPTGVIPVLDITPQSTGLNLSDTGTAFSAGQIYSVQINNDTFNFVTTGPANTLDTVGIGLQNDINTRSTNFVATYISPVLTIDVSGTGKRGDSFIIAPSTPVGNSVDIDPPLTTPLQKILTISGTPINSVAAGSYPYVITTQAPAADCAVVSATGIIEIEEPAEILIVNGVADNTGANSVCNGASYTPPASLMTLDIVNAFNLRVDPLTPLPNGLLLSLSASGTANQFEISGQISETVFVPTTFVVNLVTTGANCADAVLQISIEVEPNPTIDPAVGANLNPFVCSSEPIVPIRFEVFNPAFGLGETASSTFPPGVDGRLYQQIQLSQFSVDFLLGAGDTTAVSDTFVFNINNTPYTYVTPNTSTNIQLAAEINTFLTAQLPASQFTVLYTAGTNVIQIQHVNAGIAFNVISSDSATFLDISETQIITPPSYYEISGTPSVTLGAPTPYVYELTTSGPNCTGSTSVSGTITVQPSTSASYLSGVLNQVICDNETMTDIVYSTVGAVAIAIVTPTTPSWIDVDFDSITQQITISTPAAPNQNVTTTTVYNYQINLLGSLFGCNTIPSPISGTVTISPLDQISHIITSGAENQSICVGGNPAVPFAIDPIEYQLSGGATGATVTGLPPGITPTFTALNRLVLSGTATAIPSPTFTYNYQIITTPAGCVSATASGSITVFSQPELSLVTSATTANQTGVNAICDAQPIQTIIYEHSTTTPITTQVNFTWLGSNTLFGSGVTAVSSGTNQFVISGTPTTNVTETTIYNYQIETVGSNCEPEIVLTGSIQINPNQIIELISPVNSDNQTVCVNDQDNPATANTSSFVSIEYQLGGGASNYTVVGLPPGLTHNRTISNTILIDGFISPTATTSASPTVIYNYIITTSGTCTETQAMGVIEVHSLPTLSLTSSATSADQTGVNAICDGTPMETIVYEIGGGATLMNFSWVGSNTLSFAGSGFIQTNTGTQIILSGTPTTNVTQTTYYDYQVETIGSNCIPEIVLTGTIQINPNQTITLVSSATTDNQVVCVRDNNNPLQPETSNFVPIVYELGGGAMGAVVTGLPDGISPSTTATAIIINGQPSSSATSLVSPTIVYNYTVTTFGGCTTSTINGSIEVQSLPTLSLISSSTTANQTGFGGAVCVNQDIVPIVYEYGGGAEGITFNWTSPANVAPVTSLSQVYSGTQFIISGSPSPSATLTTTTIFEYEIVTRDSNCLPEITLTGRIEVKPEDALELTSGVGSDFPTICVGGLPPTESLTDIVYELKNGADSAIVTGLPPGIAYTVTPSKTVVISGTAQASASLSSTTLTPWIYTVTTIGCSPVVANGTITVTPKPELVLISGTAVQTPVCNLTPIADVQYVFNPAAGAVPVVTWPKGKPNGVEVSSGGFTDRLTIGGIPSVVITRTTIYPYEVTFTGTCSPSVVLRGSVGVVPTPVIDSNYILTNDVTNVSCFGASDGSIIIPDEASLGFSNRITGGMLSVQQIDEISISGTTTIGDIIRVTAAGNTFEYTVKADPYGSAIPESLTVVSNLVAKVINDGVVTSGPVIEPYVTATPIAGGISLQADVGGIPLNTSVDITQTTSLSSTITTIQENRALNYNFSWQGPDGYTSSSLSIFNLKAGDYVLTVDLNGCSDQSEVITITEPAELEVGVTLCSGSAQVSVTGGTPPYTFILEDDNGAQIGPPIVKPGEHTYTGLAIGDDYIVEVTDQSCTIAVREAFKVPTSLNFSHWDINEGVTNSFCATGTVGNGSIELTRGSGATFQSAFSGGSNIFSYLWQSSSSSGTIGVTPNIYNLPPDIYTVTVTDLVLGCSDTRSFTVGGFPVLELNAVVVGLLQDNTTGVSSSTADYVYFLACNGDTDADFSLIASGGNSNYTITPITPAAASVSNIGGSILVQDGGPGLYTFSLDDVGPNGDVCSVVKTVEVINPDPMFLVENEDNRINPICGGDLGYVEFNVVGGSPNRGPYRVTLNGGALVKSSLTSGDRRVVFDNIDTSLISSIAPTVLIEDAFGCSVTSQISSITFNVIPDLQFETVVTDIDCSVPTPGSVTFREVGPDTFASSQDIQIRVYLPAVNTNIYKSWGPNPNTSVTIPLPTLGIYNYEITDGNGCLLTSTPPPTFEVKVIGNPNPLDISRIDVTQVGCENDTSVIALSIENIQPPMSISWFEYKAVTTLSSSTGATPTTTSQTTFDWVPITSLDGNATVSDLPEGVYKAEVSDGRSQNCGGTIVTPNIILQESSIEIVNFRTIENNPAVCDNYGSNFTSDAVFRINENLNRTLGSNSFNITLLSESGSVITNPAAWDLNGDGKVDAKPRGFVYRYPDLQPDRYTLTIEESLPASSTLTPCSEVFFFEIQDYLPIEFIGQTILETDICTGRVALIEGEAAGGVPIIVDGLPTYQFEWTFTPSDPTEPTTKFFGPTIQNAPPGTYCVKITDANGCFYDSCDVSAGSNPIDILVEDAVTPFSVTANLPDPDNPTQLVKSLPPDCTSGGLNGRIGIDVAGGLGPIDITWFIEDPTTLTAATNPGYRPLPEFNNRTSLDNLVPGNYKLIMKTLNPSGEACKASSNFLTNDYLYYEEVILVTPNRELYIIDGPFVDEDLCGGTEGRLVVDIFDNNNGNLSFYYDGILIPPADVVRLDDRSWSVAIVNAVETADLKIVNEEGCWITSEISRGIGEPNFTYTSPNFEISGTILAREEITFENTSTDPYVTSEWIFGDNSTPLIVQTSTVSITPVRHAYGISGTYFATLRIYNSIGCSEEETVPISVGKGYNIMAPNVFTPNNDGTNDTFRALFSGFSNMIFTIYDYRGNVVYNEYVEEDDINNIKGLELKGWDGSNAPYSPYYIYTASGILLDGETQIEKSGTFIIIK